MSRRLTERNRTIEKSEWLALGGVLLVVAFCFFYELGGVPLLGKDEPRYAEVAREMFVTGDWITPRLAGHTWFEKPALPYWTMAAAYDVVGVTELAARLGAAVFATLGVGAAYGVARRAAGPLLASVSAVVLATSPLWFAFARGAGFDMPLASTMAVALACVFGYDTARSARSRLGWAAAAGAAAGASMLAKGLAGPVLLGMIAVAYLAVAGGWRKLRLVDVGIAAATFAAVAATWYAPVWQRNGSAFVDDFFVNHHFRRYLTNKYHHPQPIWFYPAIALGGILPWTFFLVASTPRVWAVVRRRPTSDLDRLVLLALAWALVPIVFFSLSTSKLPGYILPSFPGLAILAAWSAVASREDGRGRWAFYASAISVAALGLGLAGYAATALGAPAWEVFVVAAPLAFAAVFAWISTRRGRDARAIGAVAAGATAAVVLLATFMFAELGHRESLADLSSAAGRALRPNERIVLLGVVEYAPAFYAQGRLVLDDAGEILVADAYDQLHAEAAAAPSASVLCITDRRRADELAASDPAHVERLGEQRDRVLLRIEAAR